MKTGTVELIKFKRLQRRLGLSVPATVGVLELLWSATVKNHPDGGIGRLSNEEIAICVYWDEDPDKLVEALLETAWLDASDSCRLYVHDWHLHAPTFVRGNLAKQGRSFANGLNTPKEFASDSAELPKEFASDSAELPKEYPREVPKDTPKDSPSGGRTKPSLAKPIPTPPNQAQPPEGHEVGGVVDLLKAFGVGKAGAAALAIAGRELPEVEALLRYARRNDLGPGFVYSVCRGSEPWPDCQPPPRAQNGNADRRRAEAIEMQVVAAGRKARAPDEAIAAKVAEALEPLGLGQYQAFRVLPAVLA